RVRGRSSLTGFNPPRRRWTARTPEESARRQRAEVSTHLAVGGRRGRVGGVGAEALSLLFQPTSPSVDGEDLDALLQRPILVEFQPTSPSVDGEDSRNSSRPRRRSLTRFNPPRRRWTARTPGTPQGRGGEV